MKLSKFINDLKNISEMVGDPTRTEVQMADCIPVVNPILKGGVVYITDMASETKESLNKNF